jgi:hypothetical protein
MAHDNIGTLEHRHRVHGTRRNEKVGRAMASEDGGGAGVRVCSCPVRTNLHFLFHRVACSSIEQTHTHTHTHNHPTCRSATESGRISSVTAISSRRILTTSSVSIHVQRLKTSQAFTRRSSSLTYGRQLQRLYLQRRQLRRLRCLQSVCTACLSRDSTLESLLRYRSHVATAALPAHLRC